jgi:sensor histidine kinase regulating citrate/malate metabolism
MYKFDKPEHQQQYEDFVEQSDGMSETASEIAAMKVLLQSALNSNPVLAVSISNTINRMVESRDRALIRNSQLIALPTMTRYVGAMMHLFAEVLKEHGLEPSEICETLAQRAATLPLENSKATVKLLEQKGTIDGE